MPYVFNLPLDQMYLRYIKLDDQLPRSVNDYTDRSTLTNDPAMRHFAVYTVQPIVERHVGEKLKLSYVFLSDYTKGAELKTHTDRPMCVWTVSMTLECFPLDGWGTWPLVIGSQEVYLEPGQAVLFDGINNPHYRPKMPDQLDVYVNAYFHFVPYDFTGALE